MVCFSAQLTPSRTILSKVEDCTRSIDEFVKEIHSLAAEHQQTLETLSQANTTHFQRAEKWMDHQEVASGREERRAVIEWITPLEYASQHNDFLHKRQAGTGKWLLNSPRYADWLANKHRTLFCKGIPGSGKTMLTATVIEDLMQRFEPDKSIGIAYIYFNFRRQLEQDAVQLFSSLLRQLAQQQETISTNVRDLYSKHQGRQSRPELSEIIFTLKGFVSLSRIFIIVDAVDECQTSNGYRSNFLSNLAKLREDAKFSCFLTSRHIPDIEAGFAVCPSVEILASEEDIRMYIEGNIGRLPRFVANNKDLQEEIKNEITRAVDGM